MEQMILSATGNSGAMWGVRATPWKTVTARVRVAQGVIVASLAETPLTGSPNRTEHDERGQSERRISRPTVPHRRVRP